MRNTASGYYGNVIHGGSYNHVECSSSVINGGTGNTISGYYSIINSGYYNTILSNQSTINTGYGNTIEKNANYGVISSGFENIIENNSCFGTIVNGFNNTIGLSSCYSSIINGNNNILINSNNSHILGSNISVSGINDTTFMQNVSVLGYIYTLSGNSNDWNKSSTKSITSLGDDINTVFEYYHYYNTKNIFVQVYDNISSNIVYPTINLTGLDYITITFASIPSLNQYTLVIKQ
jgi:hypothetical protein